MYNNSYFCVIINDVYCFLVKLNIPVNSVGVPYVFHMVTIVKSTDGYTIHNMQIVVSVFFWGFVIGSKSSQRFCYGDQQKFSHNF